MKPLGMSCRLSESGLSLRVEMPSRAVDAIWDAVQTAICYGVTPKQFREEAAQAWEHDLKGQAKDAVKDLTK